MKLKKIASVLLATTMVLGSILTGFGSGGADVAKAGLNDLPFTLTAPQNVTLTSLDGRDSETTLQVGFGKDTSLLDYLSIAEDPEKKKAKLNSLGYDDIEIHAQMDWAIDDPENGWHYQKNYWDGSFVNGIFHEFCDSDNNSYQGEWDSIFWLNNDMVQTEWVFRAPPLDDVRWNGEGTTPGLKDQLKSDQYEIKTIDGEKRLTIDWTKHTAYVRIRWQVCTRDDDGGADGAEQDAVKFSEWSNVASYGAKSTDKWEPYTKKTMPILQISNLKMTDKDFNGYPVVSYDLTVPDDVAAKIADIIARSGTFRIEVYAKVYGSSEWVPLQGDFDIKTSALEVALQGLVYDGQAVTKDSPIEFRARYYADQREKDSADSIGELWSEWSNILTLNTDLIPQTDKITTDTNDTEAYKYMTETITSDTDLKNSDFISLLARQGSVTKDTISLKWKKVKGASKYAVYGNKCGRNEITGAFNAYMKLSEVRDTSAAFKEVNGQKIVPGTYYKFLVMAVDKDNKILKTSKTIHIVTPGGKFTNPKSVSVAKAANKGKLTLKKGKSFALKATQVKADKKLTIKQHRALKYESTNKAVATVSSSGKITAKKKGTAIIYVYALNGIYKKIKVTVK